MVRVPAVCDSCGCFFNSPIETSARGITFREDTVEGCPACGASGHIPDGTYDFAENSIRLLSGSSRTVSELERLERLLRSARDRNATLAELRRELTAHAPQFESLTDLLPKTRSELYAFLGILLAAATLILTQLRQGESPNIHVQQVFNQVVVQTASGDARVPELADEGAFLGGAGQAQPKPGRNDPCPCGSGKKYKRCHGS